jgi:hypothetical protein
MKAKGETALSKKQYTKQLFLFKDIRGKKVEANFEVWLFPSHHSGCRGEVSGLRQSSLRLCPGPLSPPVAPSTF